MAARDNAHHLLRAGAEGRRTLAGIKDPQTPGSARANVNQSTTRLQRRRDLIHHLGNLRQIGGDGVSHLLVFLVNHRQHLFGGEDINVGAIGVATLGQQFAQVDTHRNLFSHGGGQYKELIIPFL